VYIHNTEIHNRFVSMNTKLSTKEIRNRQQSKFPKKYITTTTFYSKNIFHYSVVKADRQPDKML